MCSVETQDGNVCSEAWDTRARPFWHSDKNWRLCYNSQQPAQEFGSAHSAQNFSGYTRMAELPVFCVIFPLFVLKALTVIRCSYTGDIWAAPNFETENSELRELRKLAVRKMEVKEIQEWEISEWVFWLSKKEIRTPTPKICNSENSPPKLYIPKFRNSKKIDSMKIRFEESSPSRIRHSQIYTLECRDADTWRPTTATRFMLRLEYMQHWTLQQNICLKCWNVFSPKICPSGVRTRNKIFVEIQKRLHKNFIGKIIELIAIQ